MVSAAQSSTPFLKEEQATEATESIDALQRRVLEEEVSLLKRVLHHLQSVRPSRPPPIADYEEAMISLRDQIACSRLEDVPALVQQMERIAGISARRAEIVIEPVDPKSPYFGHLRLREKGRADRDVLIGKTTLVDASAGVRIVDWRHAPVSQLYYRYEEGAEYEETFGEREAEGTLLVRRTVTIDNAELVRVASTEGTFVRGATGVWRNMATTHTSLAGGQGTAVRPKDMRGMLGVGDATWGREDRHLPEIAALLDPRQFELISRPESGIVVIQGGAGSGKTTIGVHRMAFLAYQSPKRFTPDKMLVIVGSPGLRTYIGEVLPALGIGDVAVETFSEWAKAARVRTFPWLEAPVEESTPNFVTKFKTHPNLLRLLERRSSEMLGSGKIRGDARGALTVWAEVLTDLEGATRAFVRNPDPEITLDQVKRAWRWCADRCPAVLELDLEEGEESHSALATDDADENDAHKREALRDERATLDQEDDALLLRAYQLLCGELRRGKGPLYFEHLFVDEAQDLSPLDLAVLLGVVGGSHDGSRPKSVTLAGDTAQRLHMDSGFRNWQSALGSLGLESVSVEPLRIAYRSTREVLEVAREILGPLADPTPPIAPRTGAAVEHHHFPNPGAVVAFLADALRPLFVREPRATVAILARHVEQADMYYQALQMAEIPNLRRIRAYEFAFRPGVEVTEIAQVKGLEYDYVVVVDVNAACFPADDESRHLLHIAATRAAHQLWIVSTSEPSILIPTRLRD